MNSDHGKKRSQLPKGRGFSALAIHVLGCNLASEVCNKYMLEVITARVRFCETVIEELPQTNRLHVLRSR